MIKNPGKYGCRPEKGPPQQQKTTVNLHESPRPQQEQTKQLKTGTITNTPEIIKNPRNDQNIWNH